MRDHDHDCDLLDGPSLVSGLIILVLGLGAFLLLLRAIVWWWTP